MTRPVSPLPPAQPVDNPVDNFITEKREGSTLGGCTYHNHMSINKPLLNP